MVTVAMISMIMVIGSALIIMRALNTSSQTVSDREWERAFSVAEAGIDDFVYEISRGGTFSEVADSTPLTTKSEILQAASDLVGSNPGILMAAPTGEAVTFKVDGSDVVYSVGYTPDYWDQNRKARVVVTEYEVIETPPVITNWVAEYALLSGGNIAVQGSSSIVGDGGNVHANGSLDADWTSIEGCGEESVSSGYNAGPGCPVSPREPLAIPLVNPLKVYEYSWFDMCPDGFAHYGPAHPNTDKANTTGTPCAGPVVTPADGGNQGMKRTSDGWSNSVKETPEGVYFVIGDFDGIVGFNGNRRPVSIITASTDFSLDCSSEGGTIWLSAQSSTIGHPSMGGITLVAGSDVIFRGGAQVDGLILAHEQIDIRGSGSSITGGMAAEDACDSPGGLNVATTELSGDAQITWVGAINTPFDATPPKESGLQVVILNQREV